MSNYDNNMRGTLGRNKRREKDTHPEFSGKCEIDGKMYWINAWVKEGNGEKFFSLSFKPQDQQQKPAPKAAAQAAPAKSGFEDMDDDIPFVTASAQYDMEPSKARRMRRYDF